MWACHVEARLDSEALQVPSQLHGDATKRDERGGEPQQHLGHWAWFLVYGGVAEVDTQ